MSGEAMPLSVDPAALHGASAVVSGQALPLATPSAAAPTSMETAAMAGATFANALNAYRAAFGKRLSTVAAGLTGSAGAYTGQEAANSQALSSLTSGEVV
jgi:hypothetical protein